MSNQTNELKNVMASFFQMNTASTSGTGSFPSNIIANPKGELKAITTRSGLVLDGPSVPMPPPFINPEEGERVEETLTDPKHGEFTIKVPLPFVQKAKPPSQRNYVVHQRDPRHPHIPYPSRMNQEKLKEKDELKCKALADLGASINFMPLSMWKKLGLPDPISTQMTLELANRAICTPEGIARDVFVRLECSHSPLILSSLIMESDLMTLQAIQTQLNQDSINMMMSINVSMRKFFDYSLEEFADELAHFTFPPGIDYLPFDAESDLREIKYLLNHDPIKEMDSILEDSVDSHDDDLVDNISEMFTDEHALDYSSPPLWDDYDDELFDLESVNDNTYDDPFDFKEEKIKESKLLIDELDLPESSDFHPFLECDLVFYEDFSEVDALSSTNNEDKVFNPGILIHENLHEVTNCATMEMNVKKATNASLILKDFNPPLYELPF
ncbi:reverse transcriptase domain-containing protein [Tanacetum coccineum]